jgi:hypothetical protein
MGPVPAKLPVGIMFFGGPFSEPTLFWIASAYEAATKHRIPPPALLGGAAAVGAASATRPDHAQAQPVKWSAGTEPAKANAPPNAADCHHHIYDARYPADPKAALRPPDALVAPPVRRFSALPGRSDADLTRSRPDSPVSLSFDCRGAAASQQ